MRQNQLGCGFFFGLGLFIVGFLWLISQPAFQIGALIASPLVVWLIVALRKRSKQTKVSRAREIARRIDLISTDLGRASGESEISLREGEVLIYKFAAVDLIEFKSQGSSYSGNTAGFGIGVFERLDFNFGWQEGTIQELPEALTVIDTGVAFVTSQRVIFRGGMQVREWLFANFLGARDLSPWATLVSVSDRERTSGLAVSRDGEIPPSLVLEIGWDYSRKGIDAARAACASISKELNEAANAQEAAIG